MAATGATAIVIGERQNLDNVDFELESFQVIGVDLGTEAAARALIGDSNLASFLLSPPLGVATLAEAALPGLGTAWTALQAVKKAHDIIEYGSITIGATVRAKNPTFLGATLDPVSVEVMLNGASLTNVATLAAHSIPAGSTASIPLAPIVIQFKGIIGGLVGIIRDDFQVNVQLGGQYNLQTWIGAVDIPFSAKVSLPLVPAKPTLSVVVDSDRVSAIATSATTAGPLEGVVRWGISEPVGQRPFWPADSALFNFVRLHLPGLMRSTLFQSNPQVLGSSPSPVVSSQLTGLNLGKEYVLFFFWQPDFSSLKYFGQVDSPVRHKSLSGSVALGSVGQALVQLAYFLSRDLGHMGHASLNTIPSISRVWWADATGAEIQAVQSGASATAHVHLSVPLPVSAELQVWRDIAFGGDSMHAQASGQMTAPGGEISLPFQARGGDGRGYYMRLFLNGQEYVTVPGMDDPLGVSWAYPPRLQLLSSSSSPSPTPSPSPSPTPTPPPPTPLNPTVSDAWWENLAGSRISQASVGQTVSSKVSFTINGQASCSLEVWRDLSFAVDTMVGQKACTATAGANTVFGQFVTESISNLRGYYVVFRVNGQEVFTVPGMNSVTDYSYPPRLDV